MVSHQTTAKYQIEQQKIAPNLLMKEYGYNLYVLDGAVLELGKIFHFEFLQSQKKLWGLFEGLKIEEEEIEEAKRSLFPEREF